MEGIIVAIVTVRLTAWRNEDRSPIVSEVGEGCAQKVKIKNAVATVTGAHQRTVHLYTHTHTTLSLSEVIELVN